MNQQILLCECGFDIDLNVWNSSLPCPNCRKPISTSIEHAKHHAVIPIPTNNMASLSKAFKASLNNNCKKCGRSFHVCDCSMDKSEAARRAPSDESAKQTAGKRRFSLLPIDAIEGIIAIREFGSTKYPDPESWKTVEPMKYMDAAMRHLFRYMQGEKIDLESGLPHIDHALCNLIFISSLDKKVKQ